MSLFTIPFFFNLNFGCCLLAEVFVWCVLFDFCVCVLFFFLTFFSDHALSKYVHLIIHI